MLSCAWLAPVVPVCVSAAPAGARAGVCVCPMEMMLCRKGASHHINQHFEQAVLLSSSQCYHVNSKKTCGSSEGLIWGTLCG